MHHLWWVPSDLIVLQCDRLLTDTDRKLCRELPEQRPSFRSKCGWTPGVTWRAAREAKESSTMCIILSRIIDSMWTCLTVLLQWHYQVTAYFCSFAMVENSWPQKILEIMESHLLILRYNLCSKVPPMGFGLTVCDYTEKNNINNPFQIMKAVLWSALSLAVPSYTSPSLQLFPQDMGTSPIISPLGVGSSNYVVLLKSSSRRKKNWVRV